MYKTLLKAVGLLACLAWFNIASAENMGGINVSSALGHPLKAEISLTELGGKDKSNLVARLASVNEFKSAGLDYPYSLPKLNFQIDTRANGELYIVLTSVQPINEPFVSLLIELNWSAGKLLREYTFLLDPPGFVAEQPKAAEVKPVEPVVPVLEPVPAVVPAPLAAQEEPASAVEPVTKIAEHPVDSTSKDVIAASAPVMSDVEKAERLQSESGKLESASPVKIQPLPVTSQMTASSIKVEKGDTLGDIAGAVKPVDVSLERMLVAMYRANAKSFDGNNMNRIKAGKILRMPEADEIAKVSQSAAVKEIRAQVADWQDYRQKLAAAQSVSPEQTPRQEAAGKISSAVAEKAPVIKESKESLKLSKGDALGDKAVVVGVGKTTQEKMADKADDAVAKSKQLQDDQKKIAKLEGINKDVGKLVELKSGTIPGKVGEGKSAASAPAAAPDAKKLLAASAVPVAQPDAVDFDLLAILEDPILLAGIVVALLGLGGLGYVMVRRSKTGQKKSSKKPEISGKQTEDIGSATGSWRKPVAPSPDTGDFTKALSPSPVESTPLSVAAALDDVDPISEADLFLNFGRDVQAEEILKDALSKNPTSNQVKLKLLSIYASRKDSNAFSKYAKEIKESGDAASWERAAVMGREIDPENPDYGGVKGEVRNREPAKAEVDFDLGIVNPSAQVASKPADEFKMDFDVTGMQPSLDEKPIDLSAPFSKPSVMASAKLSADVDATSILPRDVVNAVQDAAPMDFDISGALTGESRQTELSSKMDLDLSEELAQGDGKKTASAMDFDLSGNIAGSTGTASDIKPTASTLNFDDLVFDIPASQPQPEQNAPKAADDAGLEFTTDFATGATDKQATGKPDATTNKLDIDFGDININLNLGEDVPPVRAGGEGKDEQWHEVATKLDLAKAYQEMGDMDGAREILEEVIRDGDEAQRESAAKLMQQIAA